MAEAKVKDNKEDAKKYKLWMMQLSRLKKIWKRLCNEAWRSCCC